MEQINQLISYLMAIANFAKDIHYSCYGDGFYSKHLLADRIQEDIYEFIDQLKEVYSLGNNIFPLPSKEYLKSASILIPEVIENDDKANFEAMKELLQQTLQLIQSFEKIEYTKGELNLFDDIAQNLQQKLGLVNRQVK